jgi:putative tryptophan/tyrosine transport system substrate-binding protein
MKRRAFISLLGGAAAWPLAAHAQQVERMRRIGVLSNLAENDSQLPILVAAFSHGLQEWGWTVGRNLQIDYCWSAGAPERAHGCATELVALAPDVIVTTGASHVAALQRATRTVPIVFLEVTDPVGGGLIASLAEPGGNTTGFIIFEYGLSEKWPMPCGS